MKWTFFKNNGGQESGFHDAGVETFKGNLERYLAREIIQNSLDARDDKKKPVIVKFQRLKMRAAEIPGMADLAKTFERCVDYFPRDTKAIEFFERAGQLAKSKVVTALKVSDYNTTGVTGSDTDREDGWYSLIRCSGASSKWSGEGGSFGLGKNAPFAASRMRVVLYSTMSKARSHAFQGVARLVSHKLRNGDTAQSTGYLGDGAGASIRTKTEIPKPFARTKPGTDLIILGYDDEGEWERDLVFSVLENFWPAIHFNDLEVEVAGTRINSTSLKQLLDDYSTDSEFTAHLYHRAFTDPAAMQNDAELPTLKKVEVRLLAGEQRLTNKVAMVRKTGMVIYHQAFRSRVPYCGVFLCRNPKGNRILRDMEPPRHDEWDPNHPEKNANKKAASEFRTFIRDCVQKLAPADNDKVLSIPDLGQYLPDDEDSLDEGFEGDPNQERSKRESFDRSPEQTRIHGRAIERDRDSMQRDDTRPDGGDSETESGEGDGDAGERGDGTAGKGKGKGGAPTSGSSDGKNPKPSFPIRARIFAKSLLDGVYVIVAEPVDAGDAQVLLSVKAIGDDATGSTVPIRRARFMNGAELGIPKAGMIGPIRFRGSDSISIEMTLAEPRKFAMEVIAHETE